VTIRITDTKLGKEDGGLKDTEAPGGKPEAERATVWEVPLTRLIPIAGDV
jgi:hypothetical protein